MGEVVESLKSKIKSHRPLWFDLDVSSFEIRQDGWQWHESGHKRIYVSPDSVVRSIGDLTNAEYSQAVEVDFPNRIVRFGRDYLGHFPLHFACTSSRLLISDSMDWLCLALEKNNVTPSLSSTSVALFVALGYVPHGCSMFQEITTCESARIYTMQNGRVLSTSTFQPVEIDPSFSTLDLGRCLEEEVRRHLSVASETDVWCSGGLDSSIVARLACDGAERPEILTLGYGSQIEREDGSGELKYAIAMARACETECRQVNLTVDRFEQLFVQVAREHPSPAADGCVAAKYALASGSRQYVLDGEGGDNLFGGDKNNLIVYACQTDAKQRVGWLYAMAHGPFSEHLSTGLEHGVDLSEYVYQTLENLFDHYPGDLVRKLLYVNAMWRSGSMIFQQGYYSGLANGVKVKHPMFGLEVYRAAFSMADEKKYRFPESKLCLIDLFGKRLPASVVTRRKAGTQMPLVRYLKSLSDEYFDLSDLSQTGIFKPSFLDMVRHRQLADTDTCLLYAVLSLNLWLREHSRTRCENRRRMAVAA